jgi:hypothetical protein
MIRSRYKSLTLRKSLSRLAQGNEQGFSLPLAIGVGISMLLLGSLMIARSHVDQTSALAQVETAGALGVAEAGVARTMSMLNSPNFAHLLRRSYDQDRGDGQAYLGPDQILRSGDENKPDALINQWDDPSGGCSAPSNTDFATLVNGTIGTGTNQGSYDVLAYRFNPSSQTASLLVEGRFGRSISRVQVAFNLRTRNSTGSNGFPGLYAKRSIRLGGNSVVRVAGETGVSANVICRDCTVPASSVTCDPVTGQPTADGLKLAFDRSNLSNINGKSLIATLNSPYLPTPPPTSAAGRYDITPGITASTTLPRPGDTPDADGVFHYLSDNIDLSGSDNITINSSAGRVRLYVNGDVRLTGNGGFIHSGSPDRFALFGSDLATTSQVIELGGSTTTPHMFVYAPHATVRMSNSAGVPKIQGAAWVGHWDGSGAANGEIQVPDNMPLLLRATLGSGFAMPRSNSTTAPTNWSREGIVR